MHDVLADFRGHFFPSFVLVALIGQGHWPCWSHDTLRYLIVSHVGGSSILRRLSGLWGFFFFFFAGDCLLHV